MCKRRCRIGLENYALSVQIGRKEAEIAEKSLQLVDLERELEEKKAQLNETREKAKQLQSVARRTCGDPGGLSAERQKVGSASWCCRSLITLCSI